MRVNLLSYEPQGGWILYDYAVRLQAALGEYCTEVDILHSQMEGYDITFHINYWGLKRVSTSSIHCTMVTHIDTADKFRLVCAHAAAGVYGICMSEDSARKLRELSGLSKFVGLAPPAMRFPKAQKKLRIMIANRLYGDGRKNESLAVKFLKVFSPLEVEITIMGGGWRDIVSSLKSSGFEVKFCENFDPNNYAHFLSEADYLLVTGHDEGAISTLDALAYGVTPICTAQGFHLELSDAVCLFQTESDLIEIAYKMRDQIRRNQAKQTKLRDWDGFAKKHVDFWKRLTSSTSDAQ